MSCTHELVLNGACYYCGSTDLDPEALSPKNTGDSAFVPTERLRRPRDETSEQADDDDPSPGDRDVISDS